MHENENLTSLVDRKLDKTFEFQGVNDQIIKAAVFGPKSTITTWREEQKQPMTN